MPYISEKYPSLEVCIISFQDWCEFVNEVHSLMHILHNLKDKKKRQEK